MRNGPHYRTFSFDVGVVSAMGTIPHTLKVKAKTLHEAEKILADKFKGKDYKITNIRVS